jgi:GT2 family glycosyltransferase
LTINNARYFCILDLLGSGYNKHMEKRKVALILVNYHGLADILDCLDSLCKVKSQYQILVYVVNVDSDEDQTRLRNHQIQARIIGLKENCGFSGANNMGMKQALTDGVEVAVLLNNDTIVNPEFLDPLVENVTQPGIGLVSPKIYFYPGNEYHKDSYEKNERGKVIWYAGGLIDWENVYGYHRGVDEVDHGQFDEMEETGFATGCCVAISGNILDKVGMLEEKYFFGLEDMDWSMRIKRAGLKIIYQPKSIIWHKNAGSSGGSGSKLHQYYHNRNRILFGLRYAKAKTKLAMIREILYKLKSGSQIEKRAIKNALLNQYGRYNEN